MPRPIGSKEYLDNLVLDAIYTNISELDVSVSIELQVDDTCDIFPFALVEEVFSTYFRGQDYSQAMAYIKHLSGEYGFDEYMPEEVLSNGYKSIPFGKGFIPPDVLQKLRDEDAGFK